MKINTGFNESQIKQWKSDDGVTFALALQELTNWLLHIDWFTPFENAPLHLLKPLRIHVEDDRNIIYDFESGKKSTEAFYKYFLLPLVNKKFPKQTGFIQTKYYNPEDIFEFPLKSIPTRKSIDYTKNLISKNKGFLNNIPFRKNSIPAHIAANYSFHKCILYAKALEIVSNLPATAIVDINDKSRFHVVIFHDKDIVEDAWGIGPIQVILDRYYFTNYTLNENFVKEMIDKVQNENPKEYQRQLKEALDIVQKYRT